MTVTLPKPLRMYHNVKKMEILISICFFNEEKNEGKYVPLSILIVKV